HRRRSNGGRAGRRTDARRGAPARSLGARWLFRVPRQRHRRPARSPRGSRRLARGGVDRGSGPVQPHRGGPGHSRGLGDRCRGVGGAGHRLGRSLAAAPALGGRRDPAGIRARAACAYQLAPAAERPARLCGLRRPARSPRSGGGRHRRVVAPRAPRRRFSLAGNVRAPRRDPLVRLAALGADRLGRPACDLPTPRACASPVAVQRHLARRRSRGPPPDGPPPRVRRLRQDAASGSWLMPRVAVIFTGGTISMQADDAAGGNIPTLDGAAILARTPGLREIAEVVAVDRGLTPASHFTFPGLIELAGAIRTALADASTDGAVVVQGTDTIEETAFLFDLLLGG